MSENKWEIDGHHYTCPDCKKTMAIVVNESDEGFEFCPFCGKRMSSQTAEDRLEVTHLMGKKLDKPIIIERETKTENKMAEVARLFGKKLGEEFTVSVPQYDVYGEIKDTVLVKGRFDSRGFRSEQIDFADCYIFAELLEGGAVIVDE